jgi:hypothetical protein
LANGTWQAEYLVPAFTGFWPILGITLSRYYDQMGPGSRSVGQFALMAVLILLPLGENTQHTDLTGRRRPLAEVRQVAAFVSELSQPSDRVLTLEALYVAIEAHRPALPGFTLAQFSLQNMDTATAQRLHVVNYELAFQAIREKEARVIVLTNPDWDRLTLANPTESQSLREVFAENYQEVYSLTEFGQFGKTVHVYVRR